MTSSKNSFKILLFLTILSLIAIAPLTTSQYCLSEIEIVCSTIGKVGTWTKIGVVLACNDYSIISTNPGSSVLKVVNNNKLEVTNLAQITALNVEYATVKFLPRGIKNHITSLKALRIISSGLLSLDKEDLREFGASLEFLVLHNNKIISVDGDLFEHNPNMKVFSLRGNPIRHIGVGFFANLKEMKRISNVNLEHLTCMNKYFDAANSKIAKFDWQKAKCNDNSAKVDAQNMIKDLKNECARVQTTTTPVTENEGSENNKKIKELQQKIDQLQTQFLNTLFR